MPEKAIAILGPTASGKSALAIRLAKEINAEIISADSRQIYRAMDIGTGKEPGEWIPLSDLNITTENEGETGVWVCENIPHWMINIINPDEDFSVALFHESALRIIKNIESRGKRAIICGGTGFWIESLVENKFYPAVAPNPVLRQRLGNLSKTALWEELRALDPQRALRVDRENPIRLIRSVEIANALGHVPQIETTKSDREWVVFTTDIDKETLHEKIMKRLDHRLNAGMVSEVNHLHLQGISWERLDSFGLEYRWVSRYLRNAISFEEMRENLLRDIRRYAKRQMTWIRHWENMGRKIERVHEYEAMRLEVESFLSSR